MKKAVIPDPKKSRFGWSKPARLEEFKKLLAKPENGTTREVFQGKTINLPIIRVPIDLPKYRLANGRTTSLQDEYLAKHPKARRNLFSGDPELWDAQEAQHSLLLQYAQQSNLQSYFEDTANAQIAPILLDEYGFVVNGNRRLSTWRELLHHQAKKYDHFRYIEVAVLPHSTEQDIDRLEVKLQIEEDIQADYIWHAHANMMLAQQTRYNYSHKDLADLHRMKETKVHELFDMRAYAEEYLKSRDMPAHWSLVTEHEFAFRRIVTFRPKIKGLGRQELFKQAAFSLIDKPEAVGVRLYEAIPNIMDGLDKVRTRLQAKYKAKAPKTKDKLDDLFGSGSGGADDTGGVDLALAKLIEKPENADAARKIIVDVIQTEKQLKKDAKSAGYLLHCCAEAQTWLTAAVKDGLRAETKIEGVDKQLNEIKTLENRIRRFLTSHAKN